MAIELRRARIGRTPRRIDTSSGELNARRLLSAWRAVRIWIIMALAFVVTLEKEIPELAAYTKGKTGKAIGRESDKLDSTARRKGVETISAMLSESQEALRAQLEADGF